MALIANLVRTSIPDDGLTSIWADQTVYGTGGNPLRNQVAVFLTAKKVTAKQVKSPLTVTTFDPEIATTFTTANSVDGWHQYYFIIANNWLIGTTYNRYDLVWSTAENKFYQYINAAPSAGNAVTNPTYFLEVTDPTALIDDVGTAEQSNNLIYQVVSKIVSIETSRCYIKLAAKHAKEDCANGDCGCEGKTFKNLVKVRNLFTNMGFDELQGKYVQGEQNARLAERYCTECGCIKR